VVFGQHDLQQHTAFPQIDLIVCPYGLDQLTSPMQDRAFRTFALSLRDGGYLLLGNVARAIPPPEYFAPSSSWPGVYRRWGEKLVTSAGEAGSWSSREPQDQPQDSFEELVPQPAPDPTMGSRPVSLQIPTVRAEPSGMEAVLPWMPAGLIIVGRTGEIRTVNSSARRLLGIDELAAGRDLMQMAGAILPDELLLAVEKAFSDGEVITLPNVKLTDDGPLGSRYLDLTCSPSAGSGTQAPDLVAILVADVTAREAALRAARATAEAEYRGFELSLARERDRRMALAAQLEVLAERNANLRSAQQQMSSMNVEPRRADVGVRPDSEEAQGSNHEVEMLNEELRAANEDLETLNRELQSAVEELNRSNENLASQTAELQELVQAREDLRRQAEEVGSRLELVLAAMPTALFVVDGEGNQLVVNEAYKQLFGHALTDFEPFDADGRPLHRYDWPQLRAARGESFTMEFGLADADGKQRLFEAIGSPLSASQGLTSKRGGLVLIREIRGR
jgi:two-component system CheB/CheR fusion protein